MESINEWSQAECKGLNLKKNSVRIMDRMRLNGSHVKNGQIEWREQGARCWVHERALMHSVCKS